MTDEDIQVEYDFHVETYHCLVEAGESPVEPTSFQKYLEDWRAQIPTWEPCAELDDSRANYEELLVECPPVP